ncbi:MAG: tRNA pseudouridine synthase A [Syntrophus sp. PtaU1.Bin208]|nr:MAG: tRNA pseudouridine synthase A [Syntrophus sp. PtaU1.Bin208]
MKRNLKLVVEYDGTAYRGWQRQGELPTIQKIIEEAIGRITRESITLHGSGRTDAGVHALNQVANFRTESGIPVGNLLRGTNSLLPEDIAIKELEEVDEDFHSRYSAKSKSYLYRIFNSPIRSPLERNSAWFVRASLDLEKMARALLLLRGNHDFTSFCAAGSDVKSCVRTILSTEIIRDPFPVISISIEADGFLRHMVRNIVGTLVELGTGEEAPEIIRDILEARDRGRAGITAPPQGLFLQEVRY